MCGLVEVFGVLKMILVFSHILYYYDFNFYL
jgi:hypothetical protein